ncbi:hypothetical protein N7G274_006053 [Stereocaulon virgatum]|uniref:Uncharacterized protein n=1 Tax=Stereocaulon virgatum TaxID=373712 RepID=A0ABR4A6H9_9LECA
MSRPTKFDPQSSSISYGRRDPALYPNVLAPFDATTCEMLGLLVRSPDKPMCDDDRTAGSKDDFQMQDEGLEETFAEGAEDEKLGRRSLLRRELSRNSGYDAEDERLFKVAKAQSSIQRHPQEPPRHSSLVTAKTIAHNIPPDIDDRASIFPSSPKDAPFLPASEARRAASINAVAVYALGHKERSVADGRWNAIYTPASPPALIPSCKPDPQTLSICIGIHEAKSTLLPRRCYPRRLNGEGANRLIATRARERKGIFVIKQPISPHPPEAPQPPRNLFRKSWTFFTKLKTMIRNKISQSTSDIARRSTCRKWQAGRRKPIFSGKWVQSIGKAVGMRKAGVVRPVGLEGMGYE